MRKAQDSYKVVMPMRKRPKRVSKQARYERKTAIINLITAVITLIASLVGLLH